MDRTEMLQLMHVVLDGAASGEERAALDRVVVEDPQARAEFESMRRLFGALDDMPRVEPPDGFADGVMAALRRNKARSSSLHQPFAQSGVIGPTGSDIRVRAPSKPITARTPSGPIRGRQDMSKRGYWIMGGVAAAVLALFVGTSVDFPASGDKATGTIVPAERWRGTQPTAADVKLDDALFARVLAAVPDSRLVLFEGRHPALTQRYLARLDAALAAAGVARGERVIVRPQVRHDLYVQTNLACDAMLDTLRWSGGNTSLDALAAGLPIVTLPGRLMRARQSAAMLAIAGVPGLVAQDVDDYVTIAARLAHDRAFRDAMSARLADGAARVFDDPAPIEALADWLLANG
jgi:hypothetical protein